MLLLTTLLAGEGLDPRQRLLLEIRDKLCGGNAARLAREIGKDATYVNRLFYPAGKAGRKGIGLEIMAACDRAFFLPPGFWRSEPPALDETEVVKINRLREWREKVKRGEGTEEDAATLRKAEEFWASRWAKLDEQTKTTLEKLEHRLASAHDAADRFVTLTGDDELPEVLFSRVSAAAAPAVREATQSYGLEPILAWEHPDDLPPGEFVMVPRLDVHLSAGHGRDQVEIDLVKENPQAFRTEWIRLKRLKPAALAAMRASGDSMVPTIHDEDSLLVDTSQTNVVDGKVYALWYDGGERVKRLFRLPGGGLRIVSDNPAFGPIELDGDYGGHVRVIGRVVHRSGTGGL